MAIRKPAELKRVLARGERILGLDLGSKTIGMALSDASRTVASPFASLRRTRFGEVAEKLRRIIAEQGVGGLVIGLPVSMDGSEGPACVSARQFAANLLERIEIEIAFWDERLSTAAVERMLIEEADMTRKRRSQVVDKVAAAYILQGALDGMAHTMPEEN